jgi:phage host-nuclease inhibitor protein Gam
MARELMAEQDDTYVNEFIKELNDISGINERFQFNMQQKTNQTFMRSAPGSEVILGNI